MAGRRRRGRALVTAALVALLAPLVGWVTVGGAAATPPAKGGAYDRGLDRADCELLGRR